MRTKLIRQVAFAALAAGAWVPAFAADQLQDFTPGQQQTIRTDVQAAHAWGYPNGDSGPLGRPGALTGEEVQPAKAHRTRAGDMMHGRTGAQVRQDDPCERPSAHAFGCPSGDSGPLGAPSSIVQQGATPYKRVQ